MRLTPSNQLVVNSSLFCVTCFSGVHCHVVAVVQGSRRLVFRSACEDYQSRATSRLGKLEVFYHVLTAALPDVQHWRGVSDRENQLEAVS